MYDFAHRSRTPSRASRTRICTLEFEDHRPLYDWFLEQTAACSPRPQQIEFARLNLTYTVLSKRKLQQLVEEQARERLGRSAHAHARGPAAARLHAGGDPRVLRRASAWPSATASSTSRCSSTPSARTSTRARRRAMARRCGRSRSSSRTTRRRAGRGRSTPSNNPEDPSPGTRKVPFSPGALHRARRLRARIRRRSCSASRPGREVRLRYAYIITCAGVVKDERGEVVGAALHLRPGLARRQRDGRPQDQGTLHWVSATHARRRPRCGSTTGSSGRAPRRRTRARTSSRSSTPPRSRSLAGPRRARPGDDDAGRARPVRARRLLLRGPRLAPGAPVFNRTVSLKDSWSKHL